jgi:hypothetical protein
MDDINFEKSVERNRIQQRNRSLSAELGEVTATSPLTVEIPGPHGKVSHANLSKLASYSPTIGDTVLMLRSGKVLYVLGEIG